MGKTAPDAVALYVHAWAKNALHGGMTSVECGRTLECSHVHALALAEGSKFAGARVREVFARKFFGGSADALKEAAISNAPMPTHAGDIDEELRLAVKFRRGQFPDAFLDEYLMTEAKSTDRLDRDGYLKDIDVKYARWRGSKAPRRPQPPQDNLDEGPAGAKRAKKRL